VLAQRPLLLEMMGGRGVWCGAVNRGIDGPSMRRLVEDWSFD